MAVTCFRFLGFRSFDEIDRLTIPEAKIVLEAAGLVQVDREYYAHLQAYASQAAKATTNSKKDPKPLYRNFKSFYDYEKAQAVARGKKDERPDQFAKLKQYLRKGGNGSG